MPSACTGYEVVSDTLTSSTSPKTLVAPEGTGIVGFFGVHTSGGQAGQLVNWTSSEQCRPTVDGGVVTEVQFSQSLGSDKAVHIICIGL